MKKVPLKNLFFCCCFVLGMAQLYAQETVQPRPTHLIENGIELKIWIPDDREFEELIQKDAYLTEKEVFFFPTTIELVQKLERLSGRMYVDNEGWLRKKENTVVFTDFASIQDSYLHDRWFVRITNKANLPKSKFMQQAYRSLTKAMYITTENRKVGKYNVYLKRDVSDAVKENVYAAKGERKTKCCVKDGIISFEETGLGKLNNYLRERYYHYFVRQSAKDAWNTPIFGQSWVFKKIEIPTDVSFDEAKALLEEKYGIVLEYIDDVEALIYTSK